MCARQNHSVVDYTHLCSYMYFNNIVNVHGVRIICTTYQLPPPEVIICTGAV